MRLEHHWQQLKYDIHFKVSIHFGAPNYKDKIYKVRGAVRTFQGIHNLSSSLRVPLFGNVTFQKGSEFHKSRLTCSSSSSGQRRMLKAEMLWGESSGECPLTLSGGVSPPREPEPAVTPACPFRGPVNASHPLSRAKPRTNKRASPL